MAVMVPAMFAVNVAYKDETARRKRDRPKNLGRPRFDYFTFSPQYFETKNCSKVLNHMVQNIKSTACYILKL